MRVLMPNGAAMSIERAIAVSETRLAFNGRNVRLCEQASDMAYANAVAFFSEASGMATSGAILLGNLENGFVRGVLASLVQHDFVDLSGLKLQKAQLPASCYVFDNGASDAYMLQGFEVNMCCGYAEDAGEEDDDE